MVLCSEPILTSFVSVSPPRRSSIVTLSPGSLSKPARRPAHGVTQPGKAGRLKETPAGVAEVQRRVKLFGSTTSINGKEAPGYDILITDGFGNT